MLNKSFNGSIIRLVLHHMTVMAESVQTLSPGVKVRCLLNLLKISVGRLGIGVV